MSCPNERGEACPGCLTCDPALFQPAQDVYQGPGVTGGDEDPVQQGRNHPH